MTAEAGIVDCHIHLLPGHLAEAVRDFVDEMWGMVERRAVPVVVHAGHDVSGKTSAHEADATAYAHRENRTIVNVREAGGSPYPTSPQVWPTGRG